MNCLKHVGLIIIAFTAMSAHATTGCDKEIRIAALSTDARVLNGNKHCKVEEPNLSDFGVGHGIVGSVEVNCLETTDENIPVNSGITYDFQLAPGSCEVLSIEQHQFDQEADAPIESAQKPFGCKPCGACVTDCK